MRHMKTFHLRLCILVLILSTSSAEATCRLRRLERLQYRGATGSVGQGATGSFVSSVVVPIGARFLVNTIADKLGVSQPSSPQLIREEFECDINANQGLPDNPQLLENRETLKRINEKLSIPQPAPIPQPPAGDAPPQPEAVPPLPI